MMGCVIGNAGQITPEWLTAVLRVQKVLLHGAVTEVIPGQAQSSFASCIWRLQVSYSVDATPGAPRKLFLKISNPTLAPGEYDPESLRKEIDFYRVTAPVMKADFVIPCYDAAYDPETGACHILLKDVSDTHAACRTPANPKNCERAVDALARLHAFWWDHQRLGQDIGTFPTQAERQEQWSGAQKSTTDFIAALGDQMAPPWRATYEHVLPALPALFHRHATGRNLTLAHGDAHLGNFLFPKDAQTETTYLLDWQFWHPTIGGTDLAFMIATEWEPETRRALEQGLLERYYKGLVAGGVQGYSWNECWDDYRLSVILVSIFIPVWRWAVFQWAPDFVALERSMTAFEDLKCSDLLAVR